MEPVHGKTGAAPPAGAAETGVPWHDLARLAWAAREAAHVFDPVKVGCAVLAASGRTFGGCNVEHRFRCHDIHAEVGAIAAMVAGGEHVLRAVLVVADRERYTPCGACMDWIMQMGGPDCLVGFQGRPGGDLLLFSAAALMPHYPL
jgi:cytidine deaminase